MTNFQAKERELAPPGKPGDTVPQCPDDLPKVADYTALTEWFYRSVTLREMDLLRPGFWNPMRASFRSAGGLGGVNLIRCLLGKVEDGMTELHLQVVEAPNSAERDVIVAKGMSRKFTPVRHDGTLSGDKAKEAA